MNLNDRFKFCEAIQGLDILEIAKELLGSRISKQKISPNYKGLCPFHNEERPSFYIKPEKNQFICYGCGEEGGPAGLALRLISDNKTAIAYLCDKAGFEFPDSESDAPVAEEVVDEDLEMAEEFW